MVATCSARRCGAVQGVARAPVAATPRTQDADRPRAPVAPDPVIRPDVMYVKTVTIPLWIIAARLARKPVVVHVHEAETDAAKPLRAA